jgi:hypothetical protein
MKSLTSRTTLITAVAVAGVLIAGTAAVAANIGILNASNDSSIGSLSATDDLVPSTTLKAGVPPIVEVASPSTTQAPATTVAAGASYVVDDAGTVSVTTTPGGLGLLDAAAGPGWTAAATQPDPQSLRVAFDNGNRTVIFTATLSADGTIVTDVTEPVIVVGAAPNTPVATPPTAATSYSDGDDHDDDSYEYKSDDSDHDDDDDSDDSDDSHEYEGADDDD